MKLKQGIYFWHASSKLKTIPILFRSRIRSVFYFQYSRILCQNPVSVPTFPRTFEEMIKEYTGAKHCWIMPNGTLSLSCALVAVGVGVGDEVPPKMFPSTEAAKRLSCIFNQMYSLFLTERNKIFYLFWIAPINGY